MKPKILFLPDQKLWAYDICAKNLRDNLSNFSISIDYVWEKPTIDPEMYDLIYIFWWGERYHRKFLIPKTKIIKEISSQRWEVSPELACTSPYEAKERFMYDAGYLVATSKKLKSSFDLSYYYPLGVDENIFRKNKQRFGEMKIGWAGKKNDPIKRVDEIILPAVNGYNFYAAEGNISHNDMAEYYNKLDVICVASVEEGTPLPLIEAMACGCFPISTDVGVAPEVIQNGENGLIVDGSVEAFKDAFKWCKENLDFVREAGKKNQGLIHSTRTWKHSAKQFEGIIIDILNNREPTESLSSGKCADLNFNSTKINKDSPTKQKIKSFIYKINKKAYERDFRDFLPQNKFSKILILGANPGNLLQFLSGLGYYRLLSVIEGMNDYIYTMRYVGNKAERIYLSDPLVFLNQSDVEFDYMIILDSSKKSIDSQIDLLDEGFSHLNVNGKLIIRKSHFLSPFLRQSFFRLRSEMEAAGFSEIHSIGSRMLVGLKE